MNAPANDDVIVLCNGDISIWTESDSTLHIKCVTEFGDPVELNADELRELCDALRVLAHRIA